jgi:uncharacterized membrane protein YagU involved in acid resistance
MSAIPLAVICAGILCGILDGTAAIALWTLKGGKPGRLWQGVASAILGMGAFTRGSFSVAVGLLLHFFVAFTAAAVFVLASRQVPWLITNAVMSGMLYGALVYAVMNFVVIPLSRMPKRPFNAQMAIGQFLIHIFIVGLSISLPARHFLAQ